MRTGSAQGPGTALAGGVAALVAVALLVGCSVDGDSDEAAPGPAPTANPTQAQSEHLADLPEGAATEVPWWQDGILHVGGTTIETTYRDLVFGAGTTLVGRGHFERGSRWFLLEGTDLVPVVTSPGLVSPVVSPDGATLAWSEPVDATTRHLVAYDVASHRELGAQDVAIHPVCCDATGELMVDGVDLDGRIVYAILGAGTHLWTPGGPDVEVTGIDSDLIDVEPWPGA